jgi:sortase A
VKIPKLSPNFLISVGILFILIFSGWRFYHARILSFRTEIATNVQKGVKPVLITIPSIGLAQEVHEVGIKSGVWEIPEMGVGHLNSSSGLGGEGNIVIYGHNKRNVFGPIRWLTEGSLIEVEGEDHNLYSYKVIDTVETGPSDIDYVLPKEEETLTLYTCTGFADSKRFIVVAKKI